MEVGECFIRAKKKKSYKIHFNSMKCLTGHLFLGFSALLIIDIMQILYNNIKQKRNF